MEPRFNIDSKLPARGEPRADGGPLERMADAAGRVYRRARDLPSLLPLWPHELADESAEGRLSVLAKLRRALRAERRRARAGHWSYDLNRHLALLGAYKGELRLLREAAASVNRNGPGVVPART
jgi:hypothetical protein